MTQKERHKRITQGLYIGLAALVSSAAIFGPFGAAIAALALLATAPALLTWWRRVDTGIVGPE